jgi:sodium-dependent phosphate transporter
MAPALKKYNWILAITTIAFVASSASNGANDVANSYATSVAARTLKMYQAGILACFTEFLGAVALGSRVTGTIKSGIFSLDTFKPEPATLMLAMGCAEVGSAVFLTFATIAGLPVSTTQTVVGALAGAGIAANSPLSWGWKKGSISQIAASWVIAPFLSAAFAAILFLTIKFGVHNRSDPLKWGMRLIPFYLAFTAGVLALFIIDELPNGESLEEMGAGKSVGIILGTFFGMLAISYIFFVPYFTRRLIKGDTRLRAWHIPLGPLLYRENPPIYYPGKGEEVVTDYYAKSAPVESDSHENLKGEKAIGHSSSLDHMFFGDNSDVERTGQGLSVPRNAAAAHVYAAKPEPEERWLKPVAHLPWTSPKKIMNWLKFIFLQGVSRDVVTQKDLGNVHARAIVYDNRVEHLWTYAQVASAMMMSIAHGSNDGKPSPFDSSHLQNMLTHLCSCQRRRPLGCDLQHLHHWHCHQGSRHTYLDSRRCWSSPRHRFLVLRLPHRPCARQQDHAGLSHPWFLHGARRRYHRPPRVPPRSTCLDHAMFVRCYHRCSAV